MCYWNDSSGSMARHTESPEGADRRPVDEYTPEALEVCEKALRTIVSRIGRWGDRLILFGGLAPRYIVDAVPADVAEHTGTTDLDVVVGVAIGANDTAVYTKLQQELDNAGFTESPG